MGEIKMWEIESYVALSGLGFLNRHYPGLHPGLLYCRPVGTQFGRLFSGRNSSFITLIISKSVWAAMVI
jgi:hypothetical protein